MIIPESPALLQNLQGALESKWGLKMVNAKLRAISPNRIESLISGGRARRGGGGPEAE